MDAEERLQTDLQESKAHIATLVREVISIVTRLDVSLRVQSKCLNVV